jgi:hypothetical protein
MRLKLGAIFVDVAEFSAVGALYFTLLWTVVGPVPFLIVAQARKVCLYQFGQWRVHIGHIHTILVLGVRRSSEEDWMRKVLSSPRVIA